MAKDAYYFKHDSNARNDPKIKSLINKYGLEGYGRFWVVIEMLREAERYKLEDKKYIWEALAEQMKIEVKDTKQFIKDCVEEFELFEANDHCFYSVSLLKRMLELDTIREKRRDAALKSWENRE